MKYFFIAIFCCLIYSCEPNETNPDNNKTYLSGEKGYWIKQQYRTNVEGLTKSGEAIVTYIWKDGNIIKAYYDDFPKITDSIKTLRIKEAKDYVAWHRNNIGDTIINMNK